MLLCMLGLKMVTFHVFKIISKCNSRHQFFQQSITQGYEPKVSNSWMPFYGLQGRVFGIVTFRYCSDLLVDEDLNSHCA